MAKSTAMTSLSPQTLSTGNGIYADDIAAVIKALNYAAAKTPEMLVQQFTGDIDAIDSRVHHATLLGVASGGSYVTYYATNIWIDSDIQSVRFVSEMDLAAASDAKVKFTISGWSLEHEHTATGVSTISNTATTAASPTGVGTGWQLLEIALKRTAGASTDKATLQSFFVEALPIAAADLPDPLDE